MRDWVEANLARLKLSEGHRGYLLGRAARPDAIRELGLVSWEGTAANEAPDEDFRQRYGGRGEFFEERLILPLRSPRGTLLGWDSRETERKAASRYLLPQGRWNPVWVNMPRVMPRVFAKRPVWIVEGMFDVFALEQALSPDTPVLGAGTARLVYSQIQYLRRFASEVYLVFDMDKAGREGARRALEDLTRVGVPCTVLAYPGKDPGEIWDTKGFFGVREVFAKYGEVA